jgi:hypothetical protein
MTRDEDRVPAFEEDGPVYEPDPDVEIDAD